MNQLVPITSAALPTLVAAAGEEASIRFLEFFAANIRNPHTRRAYTRAADEFLGWCASVGVPSIAAVQEVHVAAWIEAATRKLAAPEAERFVRAISPRPVRRPRELLLTFRQDGADGLRDRNGRGTGLTHRLPGTGHGLPADDPHLLLDPARGRLELTTTQSDLRPRQPLRAAASANRPAAH